MEKSVTYYWKKITCLVVAGSLLFPAACRREEAASRPRLIFNCDGTDLLGNFMFNRRPLSLADVNAYVDAYAGTQITTFMMCSGAHNLYYRSAYTRIIGEDVPGTVIDAAAEDPENVRVYYRNFLNVEREGADVIEAVLQRARAKHLETFVSYRMNDLHFNAPDQSPLSYCDFWANHPEYWINEDIGWHSLGAFDFAHPEVRAFKTGIIAEQLDRYGHLLDGFDLDFMRFIVYFKQQEGLKHAPLMTELVRTVRQKTDEVSQRIGRKILLSVRVPVDMDFCLQKGLDVREWVRLGLVDMVNIGVHWCGHPAMPVAAFRRQLGNDRIPIHATIDDGGYYPRETYSHGMRRGMAAHIYAQGGDGIYLFNHFIGGAYDETQPQESLCRRTIEPLLHELGSPETLRRRNKIFALDDGASAAYGYRPDTPLPLAVTAAGQSIAELYVADRLSDDRPEEVLLFIRTDRPEPFAVSINGTPINEQYPAGVTSFGRDHHLENTETVYAFRIPVALLQHGYNSVAFRSQGGELKVKRLEIALLYGPVETNGYL
ncbi:MAG: hypothetical protein LBP50_11390 [Tannerella sp.]|jgi:hypothetical protein|nr:hypothetical protein [Tannerella sp.]